MLSTATTGDAQPTSSGKRLVCWEDEAGRRACGDSVPPQYANKQRIVLDSAGRTVKVIPGTLTPEERAALEAKAREEAAAKRAAEQQAAYDRGLLATYSKPQELAALRDDRLASLDTRIELSESAARRDTVSVAELRARLPEADSGEKPSPRLLNQISTFEASLADTQRSLAEQRRQREALCATFARDIQRFQELRFGEVVYASPCPPPGSFSQGGETPVDLASARAFFDRHAQMENEFDPALLGNYADGAMIKVTRVDPAGKSVVEARKIEDYRASQLAALPLAKQKLDTHRYADIKVEAARNGGAMISGNRISTLSKASTPFHYLIKPVGDGWKIVEAWSEARP